MDLIPKPDQVVAAAGNVAHTLLYGGLADLRPMPRTLIDDGELREVYHYRPAAGVPETGDPVLLVTPLAAPSLCFDLRRDCSLVEHLVTQGRPTYLLEYGQVSFKNRSLGMEHWVDEVLPEAVRVVSEHAGGRGVHLVGWSLGGIFTLLVAADRQDLPIASITVVGSPVDVTKVPLVAPVRPLLNLTQGTGRHHAGLPGPGRRTDPPRQLGLHRRLRAEGAHQAARGADPPRRHRLPRPDGGGHPLHVQHDGLPGPHVRAALPPLRQGQRPRDGPHGDRRPDHRPRSDRGPDAGVRGQHRRHRPAACRARRGAAADRLAPGAFRGRARRPPRHAHRPRRPFDDLDRHRRVGGRVVARPAADGEGLPRHDRLEPARAATGRPSSRALGGR